MIQGKNYTVYHSKMEYVLPLLAENYVDCIVTDPPYHLKSIVKRFGKENSAECKEGTDGSFKRLSKGFMNQTWDGGDIAFQKETWEQVYRVLKPGGYILAFGSPRTYHRLACAIEDAGFEIRDSVMWVYGSGFPKSYNVGKAVDAKNKYGKTNPKSMKKAEQENGEGEYKLVGKNNGIMGETVTYTRKYYETETGYEGFGTALKPAYEPIVMARKPFNTSVADNIMKYGTGAINIDGCKIGQQGIYHATKLGANRISYAGHIDRFPANLIFDGSLEAMQGLPEQALNYFYCPKASKKDRDAGLELDFDSEQTTDGYMRSNSESTRKFGANSAKRKNIHPTVKPTELMQYLIRLVAPKGSIILDPFCGSGSTGKACIFENRERNANYKFIGVEMTDKYIPIIQARLDYAENQYEYEKKKIEKETGQLNLFEEEK